MSEDYRALLEHSFSMQPHDPMMSRLEFLSEHIFDFTTYDSGMSELFARKALETCAAINHGLTFDYIKGEDDHRWFLLMVNMPFFAGRLEWGTSIRGAWWDHGAQTLESCGFWRGAEQVLSVEFPRSEWMRFIDALIDFASSAPDGVTASPAPQYPTVKIEDGELVEFDADQPDGTFYLVPLADGVTGGSNV